MLTLRDIPGRLMRITSSGAYIAAVDGLRFMAIMPVLIQHLSERYIRYAGNRFTEPPEDHPLAFAASRGTVGVFLFFAISGFILGLPFAKAFLAGERRLALKPYLIRRVTRLEPPYIIWMCCFFIVLLLKGDYSPAVLFPHLAASLFYVHNIVFNQYSWINPVAWSLEIEIQFYLLAPFLAALFWLIPGRTVRRLALIGAIAGFIGLQHLAGWHTMPWKATLLGQLPHFLTGYLMADLYLGGWLRKAERHSWIWDLTGITAFITMLFTWSAEWDKNLLFALALALFFIAGFRGRGWNRLLANPWVAVTGGMCYTIYLVHLPLLEGLVRLTRHLTITNSFTLNLLIQILVALPVVLAFSAGFFLLFEKPFMDKHWPARLAARFSGRRWVLKKATP